MTFEFSRPLPDLVKGVYDSAKKIDALTFSPSELSIVRVSGIPFQLRFCPSLAKKPGAEKETQAQEHDAPKTKKPDPFENPPPDLLIARIPQQNASHFLVLNKFPIIAHHFILATTDSSKKQHHLLEEVDLAMTLACLQAWEQTSTPSTPRRLFAFFNSGRWSGASQAHRHVQFLPIEATQPDITSTPTSASPPTPSPSWTPLIDAITHGPASVPVSSLSPTAPPTPQLYTHAHLPIYHYAARFTSRTPHPAELAAAYAALYAASLAAVQRFIEYHPNSLSLHAARDGADGRVDAATLPISYNLGMTTQGMAMLPRRREGVMVDLEAAKAPALESGGQVVDLAVEAGREKQEFCAVNGAVLAGTVMVRQEALWTCMRSEQEQGRRLGKVLEGIGIPRGRIEGMENL